MNKKLTRIGAVAALALAASFGLAACGTSSDDTGAEQGNTAESEAFVNDMKEGVQIINDQLAEQSDMTQIMLASDVDKPTEKYGMWVMPYYPSDAVEKYTSKIQIDDGSFVVTAVSAESGDEWEMDQDENMSPAEDD